MPCGEVSQDLAEYKHIAVKADKRRVKDRER